MVDTQIDIAAMTLGESLNLLRETMDLADIAKSNLDHFLETYPEAVELSEKTEQIRQLRKLIEARMIAEGTKTHSTDRVRASIVTRHDYVITDEVTFEHEAEKRNLDVGWRIWDLSAIKKYASKFRKDHDQNFPGISDVPKSWIEVTPL